MKRHHKYTRDILTVGFAGFMAFNAMGNILHAETLVDQYFDLENGALVERSNEIWQHRSGSEGDLLISDGILVVSSSASEDASIMLGGAVFDGSSSETLYVSFTLNVADLPTAGGGYFAHFRGGSSATFRGRLFIAASEDGGYQLGIGNGASKFADSTIANDSLEIAKEYRIVMSYEPATAITKLGIDPNLESDLSVVATDSVSVKSIDQFAVRQTSGIGTLQIDHLKVSTEFSDLTANAGPQKPTLKIQSNLKALPERGEPSLIAIIERTGPLDAALRIELLWRGTAEFGVDYLNAPLFVTLDVGQADLEIQVMVADDALKEGLETIELEIVSSVDFKIAGSHILIWKIQDDDLTTIELSATSTTVTEGQDEVFSIQLDRKGDLSVPLNIEWEVEGSAERGIDVDWSIPFSVSFLPGQERLNIEFEVLDDLVAEHTESMEFHLTKSDQYQSLENSMKIEILNDDFNGLLLNEIFDYANGPVTDVSSEKWIHASGDEREIRIFEGQLDLNELDSEDILIDLPLPDSSGDQSGVSKEIFVGMDLFVAKAPQGEGTYWAHFRGGTTSTFKGRLFTRSLNSDEGTFELGLSNGQSTADLWFPQILLAPAKLRLIMGYKPAESISRLWLDPDHILDPHIVAEDATSSPAITSFAFRQPTSQSSGMGRFLIDHLTISTEWDDVSSGGNKPYLFWNFEDTSADVSELPEGMDPITTASSIGLETMVPSEELFLQRIGDLGEELWAEFSFYGDLILDEDLSILQGQGPILIPVAESKGILNLAPHPDDQVESNETITFSLMPHKSYQIGFPNEAMFVLKNVPNINPVPLAPIEISVFAADIVEGFALELRLEGAQDQNYTIEISNDLVDWEVWKTGTMVDTIEILSLTDVAPGKRNAFFKVHSTMQKK
jgi:hypothetical protein